MSSTGFGNWNKGARVGDASDYIRNLRIMAQNAADRTYQADPKRNFARTTDAILTSQQSQTAAVARTNVVGNITSSDPPAPPAPSCGGGVAKSASFSGASNSYLSIPSDTDLNLGSGDFTIEWFQYWTGGGGFSRPFSKGTYPSAEIAVSYEGPNTYVWIDSGEIYVPMGLPPANQWAHIALVRQGDSLAYYLDGSQIVSESVAGTTLSGSAALTIGNETTKSAGAAFQGKIASFRWTKGTAVYTGASFTVPTTPLVALPNTKLLIQGIVDRTCAPKTVTASRVTESADTPF